MMAAQIGLSQRQKAAVIVRLLLDEEGDSGLGRLNSDAQTLLAEEMAGMDLIDRKTRDAVISEFCDHLDAVGLTFPGDLDGTLAMLGGKISEDSTDRLRRLATMSGRGDPWIRIAALPKDDILTLANSEAVELVALMLSKLPVAVASATFSALSRERARAVAHAMSMTGDVAPQALQRVGLILLQAADALPRSAMDSPASDRMGAILNFANADLREDVLQLLDEADSGFAGGVRRAIFIFAHIPERIAPRDIPRVVREVEQPVLLRALTAQPEADAAAAQFILENLSKRMADGLREEMETMGKVRTRDVEEAANEVVAAIRRLEADGEITLIQPDEDED